MTDLNGITGNSSVGVLVEEDQTKESHIFKSHVKQYREIFLQIHNNPDGDAIASGFGIQRLLRHWGIEADIIYFGHRITKPNLTAMISTYDIKLRNINDEFVVDDEDAIIVLDGQAGASNVKDVGAKNVMVIDHHIIENNHPYVYRDIQPRVGSCSTIVTKYLVDNQVPMTDDIATCLYFGLLMDTDNFVTKYTNMDKDSHAILDEHYNPLVINRLIRSSLTLDDMRVCSEAMSKIERHNETVYSYVGQCDDNLLGHLSDLISEIEGINVVIIYSDRPDGYKLSVRSYHDYITAEDIINHLTKGIGSGGGHMNKAGGYISKERFKAMYQTITFDTFIKLQAADFFNCLRFFVEGVDNPIHFYGEDNFREAQKKTYKARYLNLSDYFDEGEKVYIKTLEGTAEADSSERIIFGAKGEVYPITKDLFDKRYKKIADKKEVCVCDGFIDKYGIILTSDTKMVQISDEDILQCPVAETTEKTNVLVKHVKGGVKIRTRWGDVSLREKGYIVYVNNDNYYLCDEDIFHLTYKFLN